MNAVDLCEHVCSHAGWMLSVLPRMLLSCMCALRVCDYIGARMNALPRVNVKDSEYAKGVVSTVGPWLVSGMWYTGANACMHGVDAIHTHTHIGQV